MHLPILRYDKLLEDGHTREELDKWKLVRVSEDFRVIALGLPVPKYIGNPLDPPLRSSAQHVFELFLIWRGLSTFAVLTTG